MKMDKWYIEMNDDNDEVYFIIMHYVGGEDPIYIHGEFESELEAKNERDELNKAGITYEFSCCEGNCSLVIHGLDAFNQ